MISLDNEMYMSIVDVIQNKKRKNGLSAFPVHLHVCLRKVKMKKKGKETSGCYVKGRPVGGVPPLTKKGKTLTVKLRL